MAAFELRPLASTDLPRVHEFLALACQHDPAILVAEEKLQGFGPTSHPNHPRPRSPAFSGSLHHGPRASNARWGEFGGSAEEGTGKSPSNDGPRASNARWGEFGGSAAEEVEFRAEGSEEGGKSPSNDGPLCVVAVHDGLPVGVAAIDGNRIRLLAVDPAYRRRGVGTKLLHFCEAEARIDPDATKMWALGQAGNYLAPGVDECNLETIDWLVRRGWHKGSDIRTNLVVALRNNPLVTMYSMQQPMKLVTRLDGCGPMRPNSSMPSPKNLVGRGHLK
jgi:GNAT superfamily N-acetyltransferase